MSSQRTSLPPVAADRSQAMADFRAIRLLAGGYLAISVLAVAAIVLLRHHPAEVTSAVWTHGIIVAASGVAALALAARAAAGSQGAYRRLRIASVGIVAGIAVIIALPGGFPLWMKAEQGVAGLFMIGVAVLVNRSHVRSLFAAK